MRMRTCSAFRLAVLALALLSCTREGPQLVRHEIKAYTGENAPVRTVLDPSDDGLVLWSAAEHVTVFVGDAAYDFTGTNTSPAASATFRGSTPGDLGTYVMLSPYNSMATKTGETVSTSLPAVQNGRAGSFTDGTLVLAGTSSTESVTCKHVCSGLRFKVEGADINRVSLSGLGGEWMAGDFSFRFVDGVPVASAGTLGEVVITPSDGTYFTPDAWYYMAVLPTVFPDGICLTAQSASKGTGTLTLGGPITFSRARFKNKSNLDEAMTWSSETPEAGNTCYGPANSFCLRPGGSLSVDVTPHRILPGWVRSSAAFSGAPVADGCEILWNTGSVTASLSGPALTFQAGSSEGSALVAIKNGSTILWSFLVWVTAAAPTETILPGGAVLQETLGGNLLFQWGRKDPLQAEATAAANQGDNGLAYSIAHPTERIEGVANAYDWYTGSTGGSDPNLWGEVSGHKTVWDPCPQGWRMPSDADFDGLNQDEHRDFGFKDGRYYSSTAATLLHNYASCLLVAYYPGSDDYLYQLDGDHRSNTHLVRCVKER